MSNFPENEKLNENIESSPEAELSTVFSDPSQHNVKASDVKKKKRLPIVIAGILSVAVLLGGTIAVVKLLPEEDAETSSTNELEEIEVLKTDSDEFSSVTVTNSNGIFEFYTEEASDNEADASSETSQTGSWYLKGYDKEIMDSDFIKTIPDAAANISAIREITQRTAAECGLDTPEIKVDVVKSDGSEFSILFGDESFDNMGSYMKLSTDDKIYLVKDEVKGDFIFDELGFANSTSMPALTVVEGMSDYVSEDGTLASFDKLCVSGNNFSQSIVITPNTDENVSEYSPYVTISPTKRVAQNVESVFSVFQKGLTVNGTYALDTSAESKAQVGLDNPDIVITVEVAGSSMTYMFKLQQDGSYAAVCDGHKLIRQISASDIAFAEYTTNDFYASWVSLNSIKDIKSFTFKTPENTHVFGIRVEVDEDENEKYVITHNGEIIETTEFQEFYQECIALSCAEYTTENITAAPEYSMTFTFNDENRNDNTIEFTKLGETRYQYTTDGVPMGKVTSASFKKILKALEELVGSN